MKYIGNVSTHWQYINMLFHINTFCVHAQQYLTLCNPMDCSPPGSSGHWNFPGKNIGMGCHFLLQGIFWTQGQSLCLLHWQVGSFTAAPPGKPFSPVLILVCLVQFILFYVGNTAFPCVINLLTIQRLKQIFWQNIKMLIMNNLRTSVFSFYKPPVVLCAWCILLNKVLITCQPSVATQKLLVVLALQEVLLYL